MSYPAYPEYAAPSAALGLSYPKAWPIERLRFSILSNPVRSEVAHWDENKLVSFVPMDAVGEQGGMDASQEKPIGDVYTGYTYFLEQDVVIAKITPCFENGKGAIAEGLKNGVGFGTTEFHVLRPLAGISNRWLFYLTMSDSFRKIGSAEMLGAGGQKRVPEEFIKNFRVGIPSLPEQQHIAAFLDWKTGQIDALIAKKQALMDKLKEKRLAVITQAVTKGLNPAAPLRDSEIAWLGQVPEHWEVRRARFTMLVNPPSPQLRSLKPEDEISFIPMDAVGVQGGLRLEQTRVLADVSGGYTEFQDGDILVAKITPCFENGKAALASGLLNGAAFGTTELHVLRAQKILDRRFLFYVTISDIFSKLGESEMYGAGGQKRVPPEFVSNFLLPLPPVAEQTTIANHLDAEMLHLDMLVANVQSAIAHLTEYRTALITAATAGQIDVRQVIVPASARQRPKEDLSVHCPDDMMMPLP